MRKHIFMSLCRNMATSRNASMQRPLRRREISPSSNNIEMSSSHIIGLSINRTISSSPPSSHNRGGMAQNLLPCIISAIHEATDARQYAWRVAHVGRRMSVTAKRPRVYMSRQMNVPARSSEAARRRRRKPGRKLYAWRSGGNKIK